jgi:hypothetical protein
LVGAWDFEGTGNVAVDLGEHTHPADLAGGATQEAGAGIHGGGLVLHGLDNARVPTLERGNFPPTGTMALWLRYTGTSPAGFGVFDSYDVTRNHFFIRQRPASQGGQGQLQVAFQPSPETGDYVWQNPVSVVVATWIHIAVTWDMAGQRAALWVNGALLHDAAFEPAFTLSDQQVVLGDGLTGAIDEVRIYKVVLSEPEIKALAAP